MKTYVMLDHGVGRCTNIGEHFVEFCNTHHIVIGGSIDHFAISQQFRGYLEDVKNGHTTDIGRKDDHFVLIAIVRFRTAAINKDAILYSRKK